MPARIEPRGPGGSRDRRGPAVSCQLSCQPSCQLSAVRSALPAAVRLQRQPLQHAACLLLPCRCRNNHFNTLHACGGRLYILVTDQGYQFESDVVWEELSSVDGGWEPALPA